MPALVERRPLPAARCAPKRRSSRPPRLEHAAALLSYENGHPGAPQVHVELACALWASGGDGARARELATEALAKQGKGKGAAQMQAWLSNH